MESVSSAVRFPPKCGSGDGMAITGFILEWGLLQTPGETGKGAEGTCEEAFTMRDDSTWSGQRFTFVHLYIVNISLSSGSS